MGGFPIGLRTETFDVRDLAVAQIRLRDPRAQRLDDGVEIRNETLSLRREVDEDEPFEYAHLAGAQGELREVDALR